MRRNGKIIQVEQIPISELCLLESQYIRKYDSDFSDFNFFKETVKYEIYDDELAEVHSRYSLLYESISSKHENPAILYEMMLGITNREIIYPGLSSCIGISIILKDKTKLGAHLLIPDSDSQKVCSRYCDNIKKLCIFFSSNEVNVERVVFSGEEDLDSIVTHISNILNIRVIKQYFEEHDDIINKIFARAYLAIDIDSKTVRKTDYQDPDINFNTPNIYEDIDSVNICIVNR